MVEPEDDLLARARRGDRDAFAALVSRHREAVFRAAYYVLKDPEEALDATQEAALRAFRFLDGFDGRASFCTWLRRIATHAALDRVERRARDRLRGSGSPLPDDDVIDDPRAAPVGEHLEREERRRLVREAIDGLPPAQRAAVVLRDVEGLSYAEIGAQLGIPRGTVMSRIYYGRVALKKKLRACFGATSRATSGATPGARGTSGSPEDAP